MPNLTVTIPANVVNDLDGAASEYLDAHKIDRSAMTITQRGQAYLAAILKDIVISRRNAAAQASVAATLAAATTQAITDANGITG